MVRSMFGSGKPTSDNFTESPVNDVTELQPAVDADGVPAVVWPSPLLSRP